MSLLDRFPWRRANVDAPERSIAPLASAEALLRAGAAVAEIRARAVQLRGDQQVEQAWLCLYEGDLDCALQYGYAAASERPYDVDSRIVHGTVRLARHELEHAEHEFEAVIEEFGAESDAMDGKRAAILARGYAPLDELPASEDDWAAAATLLTTLWRMAGVSQERLAAIEHGHPEGLRIIKRALANGQARDLEIDHGSV